MCGIFGYSGHLDQAAQQVLNGLKKLEYRGYDSWGVAVATPHGIVLKKKAGKIGDATVADLPVSRSAIGHTRWATHGGATDLNAHPHLSCDGEVAVVHNGIIENCEDLKRKLVAHEHHFLSETDTEVMSHLIEEELQHHDFEIAVLRASRKVRGCNAFVVLHGRTGNIVVVRQGSPVVIGYGKEAVWVASDPAALLGLATSVSFLENGMMAVLTSTGVVIKGLESQAVHTLTRQPLRWEATQAEKGTFQHFMRKEIEEQPGLLANLAKKTQADYSTLESVVRKISQAQRVFFVGCGSSAHVAQLGVHFFHELAGKYAFWSVGSEFSRLIPLLTSNDVVIALSQSGETMDILEPLRVVKAKQVPIVAVLNVFGSSLYRLADEQLLIDAGPEIAVASTKAVTCMVAAIWLMAQSLAGKQPAGAQQLLRAAEELRAVLLPGSVAAIRSAATVFSKAEHLFLIGKGVMHPVALEAALKIKEISYLHAEAFVSGELKHGALALIDSGTHCLAFFPEGEEAVAMGSSCAELVARGGQVIGFSSIPQTSFRSHLKVSGIDTLSLVLTALVSGQLLAYELAMLKGLDPDMPRNLAKSVTVK